jgi:hypothetical protein
LVISYWLSDLQLFNNEPIAQFYNTNHEDFTTYFSPFLISKNMNCPNCGQHAQGAPVRCGYCNYKLPEMAAPKPVSDTIVLHPCWNCKHPNAADAPRCETCNAKQVLPVRRIVLHHPAVNGEASLHRAAV